MPALGSAPLVKEASGPSEWIVRWSHLVAPGAAVLDVAAGSGRHARWFAARGHGVTAIDRDITALRGIAGVQPVEADLEDGSPWPLGQTQRFGAVVVTNYLHRPLMAQLFAALTPGGILLYETFARGNETVGKPSNPAFLLAPGELLEMVRGTLRVVAFEDGFSAAQRPAFIQRICAVNEVAATTTPARYDLAV
ncbi:class I SAM-dependent methyltransferase [Trinickia fusca]|uniref:Class I SAM-dependent methyltransferase n=1 Tax=Trinickia fusca TaxID=2419777 RepID=A0A494XN60_9BURK|nr:class I SAM-dependent methyltransferase [Trinickia fusca]RKP51212.1 class I SAM-dependent methyltransferase [Trinickia fusca]